MTSREQPRPAPFITGLAGGVSVALVGVWLALAPFATGYQPDGADWVDPTVVGVATGVALMALGLGAAVATGLALREELRRRGLAPEPAADAGWGDAEAPVEPTRHDSSDLETVLAPLATALLEDLRNGDGEHAGEQDDSSATSQHGGAKYE